MALNSAELEILKQIGEYAETNYLSPNSIMSFGLNAGIFEVPLIRQLAETRAMRYRDDAQKKAFRELISNGIE